MDVSLPRNFDPAAQGWAPTQEVVLHKSALAASLSGRRIETVRYLTFRHTEGDTTGADPGWQHPTFHSVDVGIQFELDDGTAFYVTYDLMSGWGSESLELGLGSLRSERLDATAAVKAWDVSTIHPWAAIRGKGLTVDVDYRSAGDGLGFSCEQITVSAGFDVLIVQGDADGDTLVWAPENVAVRLE